MDAARIEGERVPPVKSDYFLIGAEEIAGAIKRRRLARGWSKYHLAKLANVSEAMINHIEKEDRRPSLQMVEKLFGLLGLRLLIMTEEPKD